MPSIFSLSITNPAATAPPTNVAYMDQNGGNTLNLNIGNNSGFPLTIGGSSVGKYLELMISDNIINASGAQALLAQGGWKIDSFTAPPQPGGNYTFNILPPPGGAPLPKGGILTIPLSSFQPSAKGNGLVLVQYQFDQNTRDNLNASSTLITIDQSNPNQPPLIGDNELLRFSFVVNNGGESTPIEVSASPVTPDNGIENVLQMIFNFQASFKNAKAGGNWLVDKWDTNKPPRIQLFFPYFNITDPTPAPLDLTDSFKQGVDPSYNPLTSAWNILCSLQSDNPNVDSNTFWKIDFVPNNPVPVWQLEPQNTNTHVFTADSNSGDPGPLLNLYWSHIFSGLNIDQNNPETLLFLQWFDFPGFSDGVMSFPIRKVYPPPKIPPVINSFSGKIVNQAGVMKVLLSWDTSNADHCIVSGDSAFQESSTGTVPYVRQVSLQVPLSSSYTLTAVASNGLEVSKTIQTRYEINTLLGPTKWPNGMFLRINADGSVLTIVETNNESTTPSTIAFASPLTLAPSLPPYTMSTDMVYGILPHNANPAIVYLFGMWYPPDQHIYALNIENQSIIKSSPIYVPMTPVGMALSNDNTQLTVCPLGLGNKMSMYFLKTSDLSFARAPYVLGQQPLISFAQAPQSNRIFLQNMLPFQMDVLDFETLKEVPNAPFKSVTSLICFASDESAIYAAEVDPGFTKIDPQTFAFSGAAPFRINGQNRGILFPQFMTPDNGMFYVVGMDPDNNTTTLLKVYDLVNMVLLDYSFWVNQPNQIQDIAIAPDGSRVFVLDQAGNLFALDPYFVEAG